jgi:peroxiredoxin
VADKDFRSLPPDLPVPVDDGAAMHLPGSEVPDVTLPSTRGSIDLRAMARHRCVLYVYPRTGVPGQPSPPGWDDIPGARGCTPQSCAFRNLVAAFAEHGAHLLGLSAQTLGAQQEFAEREHIPYPLLADPGLALMEAWDLPTFTVQGTRLYKRLTLVLEAGQVSRAFYPVFPPHRNAEEVLAWLQSR